jgi:flagellar biosynthesis anti-sigma factor FlgM
MSKGMTGKNVQSEKLSTSIPSVLSEPKVDAVLTSKSKEALKVMAENPSINMEAVERIKQKIKNGEYPIDFDKLADKLLESYWTSES